MPVGRAGTVFDDGFVVLNAGGYRTGGLTGAYADMMGPEQLAALQPGHAPDMDGDMDQRLGSLDLSAEWRGWQANLRLNRRDYGIYAFTPPFDEGTRVQLDTLHASLGYAHRFSDDLGLQVTGIYSAEHYDAYQYRLPVPRGRGDQRQDSRRAELELDLHWRPDGEPRRHRRLPPVAYRRGARTGSMSRRWSTPGSRLEPVTTHDLFAQASWRVAAPLRLIGGAAREPPAGRVPAALVRLRTDAVPRRARWRPTADTTPLNGQLALLWTPTPDQVLKLAWGTASQDSDQFNLPEAERIETLEANYTLTRPRWMSSAGLFQNRLSQLVRTIQRIDPETGLYITVDDNSGRWRTRGLELIAEARPLPGLQSQRQPHLAADRGHGAPGSIRAIRRPCWPSSRRAGAAGP